MALDPARIPWRLLGELLVDRSLLADADLDAALSEQERTGQRLGEILVGRGLLSAAELARALAEQMGVELREREAAVVPLPRRRRQPAVVLDLDRGAAGCLLFLPSGRGYRLLARPSPAPAVGGLLTVEGGGFRVARVGPSPFPADHRPCAFLEPA